MIKRADDRLEDFIARHLENIRRNLNNPAEELGILKKVTSQEELSFPEAVSIANAGQEALLLRCASSPTGVAELHEYYPKSVINAVQERVKFLEGEGVSPAPVEEVTSENMEGFLNSTSNYLYGCVSSAFDTLSDATEGVLKARKNPGKATMFETFCNVVIDQSFKGIVGGEGFSSIGSRLGYGAATVYGGGGVNATTGTRPKDTAIPMKEAIKTFAKSHDENILVTLAKSSGAAMSAAVANKALDFKSDIPDIVAHGVVGALGSGSLSGGVYSASKRAAYKNLWKMTGGKAFLNRMEFTKAADYYLLSKKLSGEAMRYISHAAGEISDTLIEEYTGIPGPSVKLAAGAVSLAILMTINSYLHQDKVKSHNPEVVSVVEEELASNIKEMQKEQQEEKLRAAQSSAKLVVKEALEPPPVEKNFHQKTKKYHDKSSKARSL